MTIENVEQVEKTFMQDLEFLSEGSNLEYINNALISPIERYVANSRGFYTDKSKVIAMLKAATTALVGKTSNSEIAKSMVKRYCASPFGIFDLVIQLKASDIFIVSDRISMTQSNADRATEIVVPERLLPVYREMVKAFITLTMYASSLENTKFDKKNAILDYTTAGVRFNVAHPALNASRNRTSPIISLRKQTSASSTGKDITMDEKYTESLGVSEEQLKFIRHISVSGSGIVFGETGSGKTTLLKYMGNHRSIDKRNLISIEDTPELFLPVNIAYLTNDNFKIQDLFKVSLRENPSHIIVGETRGGEIVDILEAGLVFCVLTSLHANSIEKLIMRIVFMVKASKADYSTEDINALITTTMDGFVYMKNRKVIGVWRRKPIEDCDLSNAIHNYVRVN